ncbi:MAG: hypothetical protein ACO1QR_10405 [Chthoniobacteraceae bacterium]
MNIQDSAQKKEMDVDVGFLFLSLLAALTFAFAAGAYSSFKAIDAAVGGLHLEGGKGFAANAPFALSATAAAVMNGLALLWAVGLIIFREGYPRSWPRIAGYLLLTPSIGVLLRILWVQWFR